MIEALFTLPSGLVLTNRLVKASTTEGLAGPDGRPGEALGRLYAAWAAGRPGAILTGNVMVDEWSIERPGNVLCVDAGVVPALSTWREQFGPVPGLVQLSHAGRQVNRLVNGAPVSASEGPAVGMFGMFGRPRALSVAEIEGVIAAFARAAAWVEEAGFAGVQVHAAHGYLLAQFLSPLTNRRTDGWGGGLEGRARLLMEVLAAVRKGRRPGFTVAVKLNSADFQRGGFEEEDALRVVGWLGEAGVDLLEISGGNYEAPALFGAGVAASTVAREGYFLDFARRVRGVSRVPLLVTGGFRSRAAMEAALREDALDLVGLARPILLDPGLPARLVGGGERGEATTPPPPSKALRAITEAAWYDAQIQRVAAGRAPERGLGVVGAIAGYLGRLTWGALRHRWHRRAGGAS